MTGEPHTALIALRQRQLLARHGRGEAGPQDLGRPGFAFWGRRARAEAEVGEARTAALQADVQLAEAVAAGGATSAADGTLGYTATPVRGRKVIPLWGGPSAGAWGPWFVAMRSLSWWNPEKPHYGRQHDDHGDLPGHRDDL